MTTYRFASNVKGALLFVAILFMLLIITIPVGIWFLVKRASAHLTFDDEGFEVKGLGGARQWRYSELERLGVFSVQVTQGGPLRALNGGRVAVNLVARTREGKTLKFMLSRFERSDEILERIEKLSGLPIEEVRHGAIGIKWPDKPAA